MRKTVQNIKFILKLACMASILACASGLKAQSAYGEIRGEVTMKSLVHDSFWKTTITLGKAYLHKEEGESLRSVRIETGGAFYFKNVNPGTYKVVVKMRGYRSDTSGLFLVSPDALIRTKDLNLIDEKIKQFGIGIITLTGGSKGVIIPPKQIGMGIHELKESGSGNDVVTNIAMKYSGVSLDARGRLSIIGNRPDATISTLDGVYLKTRAVPNMFSIGQAGLTLGGVPAKFGDFTGGVISYSTTAIGKKPKQSIDFNTSSLFNNYHQNSFEYFASGPLYIKDKGKDRDSNGLGGEQMRLGYFFNARVNYANEPNPSALGYQIVDPNKLDEIIANPLILTDASQGLLPSGSLLKEEDILTVNARPDADRFSYNAQGKIEFTPNYNSKLTFYGSANVQDYKAAGVDLLNYRNNAKVSTRDYLTYLSYRFDLKNPSIEVMNSKYHLSKAFFTFRADFQQSNSTVKDANHQDNILDYGYIGKFTQYSSPVYNYVNNDNNPDKESRKFVDQNGETVYLREYYEMSGTEDTAYTFEASTLNPERARYTETVFDYAEDRFEINEQSLQSNLGLLNGSNPANVYGLWQSPGQVKSNYSKNQSTFISFSGYGEASLNAPLLREKGSNPHDFQYGIFFEQSFQRGYSLQANNLWLLMPQLVNTHLTRFDLDNPELSYNSDGVFTDTINYNRIIDVNSQNEFDKSLRQALINKGATDVYGNPINASSIIDVNSLNPQDLSLDMFSADELLNNGNSYVNYYGYDYLGNKTTKKTNIDQYLNDKQNRTVGAFQPTYIAAWIQDQFDFKDLVFRAGLRMERYDANQPVLADPYSLFPIRTAAEVKQLNGLNISHPEGIGADYKVYVNDVKNPTQVVGYRNGDQWYDANGKTVSNPDIIANQTSNGDISPYLVDAEQKNVQANAFKDYESKVYFLPRFLFSFPVNNGVFFANYDVQTQRPSSAFSRGNISDYVFLENTNGGTIANPGLQPRVKTSYEIGFKQLLANPKATNGLYADIGIVGGFASVKNDINMFFYNQAYPISYTSYTNIDNSSIKNLRVDFNLRIKRNLSFRANYTLLYANGTGSDANSSRALIQSNQPNLRTNLPLGNLDVRNTIKLDAIYSFNGGINKNTGKDQYTGPVQFKKILEYATIGLNFNAVSGLPYTASIAPVQLGSNDRSQIKGNPFGSRLPYNYNINLRISKAVPIGNKEGSTNMLNFYLQVSNILNAMNQVAVYSFTGAADNDGFLASPIGQQQIASAVNAEAFEAVYRARLQNPSNFRAPRTAQIGVRMNF